MDKSFKGTEEEYKEFRRKRNIANKKYDSKPEIKAKKKIYKKQYDINNKEKISEYGFKLRERPETKLRIKKWREDNKEHLSLKGKEWRKNNKDKKKKGDREYKEKNRRKIYDKHNEYKRLNPDRVKRWCDKYNHSPKGRIYQHNQNHQRLASRKKRKTDLTRDKIREILNRDKVCVYCGNDNNLELDHIISLKKGGSCMCNNFVVACEKCNCRKSCKDVIEWCKENNKEVPKIVIELLEKQHQGV
jgi:hypothetical protein